MTLTSLAVRNLARNKFRVALTIAGVAMTIVVFLLLRTVIWAWASGAEWAAKDRVVTRHKVTFVMALPKRYVEIVRQSPHVKQATWANWFGAKDPKHEQEFFGALAVDPATYFSVYDEMKVPDDQMQTFVHDRQGAIVGDVLARKLGWKVGDRVTLQSGIYPGDWQFRVDGVYTATAKSVDRSTFVFQWDFLNESLPPARRDMVGWIVSRVDDPARVADIGATLDRRFDDAETPTLSQDERSFNASFMAMFSAVLKAMNVISAVILGIMTLILGNTIAMGVRERTGEYGVLRAIGFLPGHVALWIVGESLVLGVIGGLAGVALAWPFINLGVGRFVEENLGAIFPYFRLEGGNIALALALAALLGGAAAGIPAWRASKLRVVDAVRRVA
ncbi:MAG TPA: FtsX-like permease family protein [Polyangiaceae bacterium]|nr:FtsX-like permease family protein [Polyangiaceae bacterium]